MRAMLVVVALTGAITVSAMAGAAPLSHSTPVNTVSARAPVDALFVLAAGAGLLALAPFVALLASARRRKDDEPEFAIESPRIHWVWKVVAIALPLALGAALITAAILGTRNGSPKGTRLGQPPPLADSHALERGHGTSASPFVLLSWVPWTIAVIVLLAVVAGALLLVHRGSWTADRALDQTATRTAIDAALDALDLSGDPRRAVIAAYAAMERTLADCGVSRLPAETPREYLRRLLVDAGGAEPDARTLTGLFEEACFSWRPVSEQARDAALVALRSLQAGMGGVTR